MPPAEILLGKMDKKAASGASERVGFSRHLGSVISLSNALGLTATAIQHLWRVNQVPKKEAAAL